MPIVFRTTPTGCQQGPYGQLIVTPITNLSATSTVVGQIVLTWSGGAGYNVQYSYALSNGTIQSTSGINPTTITLTSTNSITSIVTLTATVLGGSTSAISNSVTTSNPFFAAIPTSVTSNGLPTMYYPFWSDLKDYYSNTSTGVVDYALPTTGSNVAQFSTTKQYKTGANITGSMFQNGSWFKLPDLPAGYGTTTGGMTMCTWFNITSGGSTWVNENAAGRMKIFSQGNAQPLNYNFVNVPGGNGTTVNMGQWYFIVITAVWNGAVTQTVKDTANNTYTYTLGGGNWTSSPGASAGYHALGADNGNETGAGLYVNNFSIWPRVLSAAEITALYNM